VNPGSSLLPGRRWNLVRFIVVAFALVFSLSGYSLECPLEDLL
jgi:hypothetical protein